jgi:hypothetical protein
MRHRYLRPSLSLPEIYLYRAPIDFRKQAQGLAVQGKRMKHFTPPESRQGSFHPVPLSSVYAGCRL